MRSLNQWSARLAASGSARFFRSVLHGLSCARQNLAQCPLYPVHRLLNQLDLLGLLGIRSIGDGLQRIAYVVVHCGDHRNLVPDLLVPSLLICKHNQAGNNTQEKIVHVAAQAGEAIFFQQGLHHCAQYKEDKPKEEAARHSAEQGRQPWNSRQYFLTHAIYSVRIQNKQGVAQ